MENLKNINTCELVAELKKREGVVEILAEPYVKKEIVIDGPAILLVITD